MAILYTCMPGDGDDAGVALEQRKPGGLSLTKLLEKGTPPIGAAMRLMACLAEIVEIAREDGRDHGDIDIRNVYIEENGLVVSAGWEMSRTDTAAPEAVPMGHKTDLYGLGRVLFAVLTGDGARLNNARGAQGDAHDKTVERLWSKVLLDSLPPEVDEAVRACGLGLLRAARKERTSANDALQTFDRARRDVPEPGLREWAAAAITGDDETLRGMTKKEATSYDSFDGPTQSTGPLQQSYTPKRRGGGTADGHTMLIVLGETPVEESFSAGDDGEDFAPVSHEGPLSASTPSRDTPRQEVQADVTQMWSREEPPVAEDHTVYDEGPSDPGVTDSPPVFERPPEVVTVDEAHIPRREAPVEPAHETPVAAAWDEPAVEASVTERIVTSSTAESTGESTENSNLAIIVGLVVLAVGVLVVGGGLGFAYLMWTAPDEAASTAATPAEPPAEPAVVPTFKVKSGASRAGKTITVSVTSAESVVVTCGSEEPVTVEGSQDLKLPRDGAPYTCKAVNAAGDIAPFRARSDVSLTCTSDAGLVCRGN